MKTGKVVSWIQKELNIHTLLPSPKPKNWNHTKKEWKELGGAPRKEEEKYWPKTNSNGCGGKNNFGDKSPQF